jgi:hypothetical protein
MPTAPIDKSASKAGSARSPRQIELDMIETMEQSLSASKGIAELILNPTAENRETILAIREFMLIEIDPDLAMTDPARYRKLSRLKMEMTLRGWRRYFEG